MTKRNKPAAEVGEIGTCFRDEKGRLIFGADFSGVRKVIEDMALPKEMRGKPVDCAKASDAKRSILSEADDLVNGSRQSAYGPAREDFGRTVALFKVLTGIELTVAQGLEYMVCVKLSRSAHKFKRDNYRDLCGYASLLNDIWEEKT